MEGHFLLAATNRSGTAVLAPYAHLYTCPLLLRSNNKPVQSCVVVQFLCTQLRTDTTSHGTLGGCKGGCGPLQKNLLLPAMIRVKAMHLTTVGVARASASNHLRSGHIV